MAAEQSGGRVAVVDIGSNSIRLVVYEGATRAPIAIFNEKVLCALGRTIEKTGRLNPDGVVQALENLTRFARLARGMDCARIDAYATAAVRDASDGAEFVRAASERSGMDIRVISGEEEARLSAMGVIAGTPNANGAMGDLGGGSLELVALDSGVISAHATMPLGPLRLIEGGLDVARALVDESLGGLTWLSRMKGRIFYPVGGAWRAMAKLHMEQSGYPLHVIHHYAIDGQEARDFAHFVSRQGRSWLEKTASVPKRRIDALPFAALALERILAVGEPREVMFSAYGLRDGHMLNLLPPARQADDPLIDHCAQFAHRIDRFSHAELLSGWTDRLFQGETAGDTRLRRAACLLSDICWTEHPDYRAEHAFLRVLRMPFPAVDHWERAWLALAVFARYNGKIEESCTDLARNLLTDAQRQRCATLGQALRLAHTLTGGALDLLRRSRLDRDGERIMLTLPDGEGALVGDAVTKRLEALAKTSGLKPELWIAESHAEARPVYFGTGR